MGHRHRQRFNSKMMQKLQALGPALNRVAIGAVSVGAVGYALNESMYTVDGGERAIIFDRLRNGTRDFIVKPGTHFLIPPSNSPSSTTPAPPPSTSRPRPAARICSE